MQYVIDFFTNYWVVSAGSAWILAQLIKAVIALIHKEKRSLGAIFFANGGMPSSHSAAVCALNVACLLGCGVSTPEYAISLLFAIIVLNDACGVRYETGEQAKIINKIMKELFSGNPEEINTGLKTLVGHTPFQVFMGALLGIGVAIGLYFIMH